MSAERLLLIEDEPDIAAPLAERLRAEGYVVDVAATAVEAEARIAKGPLPALILLDWKLPDGQGIDLLRAWRAAGVRTPVIVVTARTDVVDRVLGLELGADDYVSKPFDSRELVARIRARLRAAGPGVTAPEQLRAAGVVVDVATREVRFRGVAVALKRMEFELLRWLVEHPGRVFSRDELLNGVWGYDRYPTTRTVDTHVLGLRQKLAPELIETVRGVGYRLVADPDES